MSAAEELEGWELLGLRTRRKWKVVKKLEANNDVTPGQFSVGYIVESDEGRQAFMKASDLHLMIGTDGEDLVSRLQAALSAHEFERTILDHCHGSAMDRVVTAIDHGNCPAVCEGVQDAIFFLIFELAQCDIRSHAIEQHRTNDLWRLSAIHHLAVAIQQLHGGGVCHNDIKPANILVIDSSLQKLADLGQATSEIHRSAHHDRHDVGDPTYAAPEILYATSGLDAAALCDRASRRVSDLYQLGSIANYLFTGRMVTPDVVSRLEEPHRPPIGGHGWNQGYKEIVPYWRAAFGHTLGQLREALTAGRSDAQASILLELVTAVRLLAEPDPALRGHPLSRQGHHDPLGVDRFVSLFDSMRSRLMVVK